MIKICKTEQHCYLVIQNLCPICGYKKQTQKEINDFAYILNKDCFLNKIKDGAFKQGINQLL